MELALTVTYSNLWNTTGGASSDLQFAIRATFHEKHEGTRQMAIARRGMGAGGVEWRVKRRSYGVHVKFDGDGMVAVFSWSALVGFVLTSLTQLALASTITEQVLTLFPPEELWLDLPGKPAGKRAAPGKIGKAE
jgi:hypothetical protein